MRAAGQGQEGGQGAPRVGGGIEENRQKLEGEREGKIKQGGGEKRARTKGKGKGKEKELKGGRRREEKGRRGCVGSVVGVGEMEVVVLLVRWCRERRLVTGEEANISRTFSLRKEKAAGLEGRWGREYGGVYVGEKR